MNRRNFLRAATAAISTTVTGASIAKSTESDFTVVTTYNPNGKTITSSNGVERMRIGADGSVGIGTTSPRTKLYVGQSLD